MFVPGAGKASCIEVAHAVIEVWTLGGYAALRAMGLLLTASQPRQDAVLCLCNAHNRSPADKSSNL